MADKTEHSESNRTHPSRYRVTVFLTLFILLLAGTGYFGARFWFDQTIPAAFNTDAPASENKVVNADIGLTVDLSEFLVNIISEDNSHYLRTSMTIEVSNSNAQEELIRKMPQVRDAILLLISNKTFEELYDLYGKQQLKAEIMLTIDALISTGEVTAVYLTDFFVQ